jgi:hypothetical protein
MVEVSLPAVAVVVVAVFLSSSSGVFAVDRSSSSSSSSRRRRRRALPPRLFSSSSSCSAPFRDNAPSSHDSQQCPGDSSGDCSCRARGPKRGSGSEEAAAGAGGRSRRCRSRRRGGGLERRWRCPGADDDTAAAASFPCQLGDSRGCKEEASGAGNGVCQSWGR